MANISTLFIQSFVFSVNLVVKAFDLHSHFQVIQYGINASLGTLFIRFS